MCQLFCHKIFASRNICFCLGPATEAWQCYRSRLEALTFPSDWLTAWAVKGDRHYWSQVCDHESCTPVTDWLLIIGEANPFTLASSSHTNLWQIISTPCFCHQWLLEKYSPGESVSTPIVTSNWLANHKLLDWCSRARWFKLFLTIKQLIR